MSFDCTDGHDDDPFRVWCGLVGELRSLLDVPCLALTATASTATRSILNQALGLRNAVQIVKSPDRPNIFLCVKKVHPGPETTFCWLLQRLNTLGINCPRVLVYCKTQNACAFLYTHFQRSLGGKAFFPEGENRMENRLVEMFHSSTPEANKELILESLSDTNGKCRIVFVTNALGMGIDVKGLYTVLHNGPSNCLEAYMQEIGRCGRDGTQSLALLYYHGQQLAHVDSSMYQYLMNSNICRRHLLLSSFGAASPSVCIQHNCCDICAETCTCDENSCSGMLECLGVDQEEGVTESPVQSITLMQQMLLREALNECQLREEMRLASLDQQPYYTCPVDINRLSQEAVECIIGHLGTLHRVTDVIDLLPELSEAKAKDIFDIIDLVLNYKV